MFEDLEIDNDLNEILNVKEYNEGKNNGNSIS